MKADARWVTGLAALLAIAGVVHFVAPGGFDAIVPRFLPGSRRVWTFTSAAELSLAVGVVLSRTRRVSATPAAIFFAFVFPANIQMALDWRSRPAPEFTLALFRLPLQVPIIWWAWQVRHQTTKCDTPRIGGRPQR